MFEADLEEGREIQFLSRDNRMMLDSVRTNVPKLVSSIRNQGQQPLFALYISCGGRTAEQSVTEAEEGIIVQQHLAREDIPLLGFYTGVEIAPLHGRSRGLDWTGVLVVLAGRAADA
jgi:small ligand-binding sensory domain FIST